MATNRLPFLILLILFLGINNLVAQTTFQRLYTVADSSCSSNKILEMRDGSMLVCGIIAYTPITTFNTKYDGLVWKRDKNGNTIWALRLKRENAIDLSARDMVETEDGGCLVLITYFYPNEVVRSGYLKIDSAGNIIWAKSTVNAPKTQFYNIIKITGGYLITGADSSPGQTPVFKIDDNGTVIWGMKFNGYEARATEFIEFSDGTLYLPGNGPYGGLLKLGSSGEIIFSENYADTTGFASQLGYFFDCWPVEDSLALWGIDYTRNEIVILKADLAGNPSHFTKRIKPIKGKIIPINTIAAEDGAVILILLLQPSYEPFLIKINKELEIEWAKIYDKNEGIGLGIFSGALTHSGDGYWLTGDHRTPGKLKIFMAKMDKNGDFPGGCCAKPYVVQEFYRPAKKMEVPFTISPLAEIVEATVLSHFISTQEFPFCPISPSIVFSSDEICPGTCVEVGLDNLENEGEYLWNFTGATPDSSDMPSPGEICYSSSGTYPVQLYHDGCLVDSAEVTVKNGEDLFPNAFTPNGDDHNDVFMPILTCPVTEYALRVFNRWGNLVFETNDPEEGWDGTTQGKPAPVDVYIYQVQYFIEDGATRTPVRNVQKEVSLVR